MAYQHLFLDYETRSLAGVSKKSEKKKKKGKQERGIKKVGLDNYAKHPSTEILMLAWALDHEEIQLWQPHLGPMPQKLLDALADPTVLKIAWHSPFEYAITQRVLPRIQPNAPVVPLSQWRDPIILAHNLSLPGKLEKVGDILHMEEQKSDAGKKLVDMFSFPASLGGEETLFGIAPPLFRDWASHPDEWAQFESYCVQDVRAERDLWYRMLKATFPESEWAGWLLDQKINWLGIPIPRRDLPEKALRMALRFISEQNEILKQKTGLKNPNSDTQIKGWLSTRGWLLNSLRVNLIKNELKNPSSTLTTEAKEVLRIRQNTRKSSYTKLEKLLDLLSDDNRLKNQFRFMGASRTGRWASGGGEDASMQVQNLSRGEKAVKKKLDRALELLDREDYDGIVKEFTNTAKKEDSVTVVEFVITLLRSMFQAFPGKKFIVADKNAIENRMLGWAAGCKAILDVFRTCNDCGFVVEDLTGLFLCPKCGCKKSRDPYLSFGTNLYNKTYEQMWKTYKVDKNEEERQNSKPPVLGAGYGLGGGEMFINEYGDEVRGGLWGYALQVCGVDMPKELAHKAVDIFRKSYPEVVQFWTDLEEAFKQVLINGGEIAVGKVTWGIKHTCQPPEVIAAGAYAPCNCKKKGWIEHPTKGKQCVLTFSRRKMSDGGYMVCLQLPSGRVLHYINAKVKEEVKKGISKRTGEEYEFKVQTLYYDGIEHSATKDDKGHKQKQQHKWGEVKTYGGKICLAGDTQVITDRGIKSLKSVSVCDKLWDGQEWVWHGGVVCNGLREATTWMGLTGTSDHQIQDGAGWHELGKTTSRSGLSSLLMGLASGIQLWCSLNREKQAEAGCDATAATSLMWTPEHYDEITSILVLLAAAKKVNSGEPITSDTMSFWTRLCGRHGLGNSQVSYRDATTRNVRHIAITAAEGLLAMSRGDVVEVSGYTTPLVFRVGMTQLLNLIESTTMEIMNPAVSDWFPAQKIQTIAEQLSLFLGMEKKFHTKSFINDILQNGAKTLSTITSSGVDLCSGVSTDTSKQLVYDVVNCGPRNRFTVVSISGPIVVHNCENVIQAMSRDDLLNSMMLADEMGFDIWGLFHDEIATEVEDVWDGLTLGDLVWCMTQVPWWAPGFILGAEGYESKVYKK